MDDELAGGAVVLHVVVSLRHLLQAVVAAVPREGQLAGRDRVTVPEGNEFDIS